MSKFTYKMIKDDDDLLLLIPFIKNYKVEKIFVRDENIKINYNTGSSFLISSLRDEEKKELNIKKAITIVEFNRKNDELVSSYDVELIK